MFSKNYYKLSGCENEFEAPVHFLPRGHNHGDVIVVVCDVDAVVAGVVVVRLQPPLHQPHNLRLLHEVQLLDNRPINNRPDMLVL